MNAIIFVIELYEITAMEFIGVNNGSAQVALPMCINDIVAR